ncbi:MAG: permease-like cell division protein FtsX [Nitrospirales bacterium]|jgi:cell division transport system permease protein
MKRFWYFFREAFTSLRTHQASTLIGIITTAFTLTSFGIFLLLYHNVHNIIGRVQHNIEIVVYPKEGIASQKLQTLQEAIQADPAIDSVTVISKKDALKDFNHQFPDEAYLLEGLGESPFPASLVLNMAEKIPSTDIISNLVNRLQHNPDIERVRYNRDWIERLTLVITYMELGSLIVGGILALASITIIANTVQLAFYTRQEEIEILRLIGATSLFISIPYIIEGAIIGALGGGLALSFLRGGFELFKHKTQGLSIIGGFSSVFDFFPLPLSVLLIAGGVLLGCFGTLTTMYGWMRFRL